MVGKKITEVRQADKAGVDYAVEVLRGGGLVAIPTETVYGLAARADCDPAIARIYAAKGRPSFNPLIVHVASVEQAMDFAEMDEAVVAFARKVWPGPVTLVLPRKADAKLAAAVTAGLGSVALRIPGHDIAREILMRLGIPLAAPSANASGFTSPTTPAHVLATLEDKVDLVLDAGPCERGVESTILKYLGEGQWQTLRAGPLAAPDGGSLASIGEQPHQIEAPGQMASHYSPGKPVRLAALSPEPGEFMIGFGEVAGDCTLSAAGDLDEAARQLYACLHLAAASAKPRVAIAPVPATGIGVAINDRLRRAAA